MFNTIPIGLNWKDLQVIVLLLINIVATALNVFAIAAAKIISILVFAANVKINILLVHY